MKKFFKTKGFLFFIISVVLIFVAHFLSAKFKSDAGDNFAKTKGVQQTLISKEKELSKLLDYALQESKISGSSSLFSSNSLQKSAQSGFSIFVFNRDSLEYWSDASISIENHYDSARFSSKRLLSTENGWYCIKTKKEGDFTSLGLILIKHQYRYENDYLSNSFHSDYNLDENVQINEGAGEYTILTEDGGTLCSLEFNKRSGLTTEESVLLLIICFSAFLFLIASIFQLHKALFFFYKSQLLFIPGFILDVFILRFFSFHFKLPGDLYSSPLFSPLSFACSEILPSFGDLLVNAALFLILSYTFYRYFHLNVLVFRRKVGKVLSAFIGGLILVSIGFLYLYMLRGLKHIVIDSVIPYTLNNIFNLDIYSIFGFMVMASIILGFVLITYKLVSSLYGSGSRLLDILFGVFFLLVFFLFQYFNKPGDLISPLSYLVFIIGIWLVRPVPGAKRTFTRLVFCLIFFSMVGTYSLYNSNLFKENEKRKSLAQKLANSQDPVAEYLYTKIEPEITSDTTLIRLMPNYLQEEAKISSYLMEKYFNGYWDKYQIQITLCAQSDSLFIKPAMINQSCNDYFGSLVKDVGKETSAAGLTILNYGTGGNSYLSQFKFAIDSNTSITAYIELYSKFIPKGLGYPELLIDKKIFLNTDLSNYSYARYRKGNLADAYGKYYYSMIQDGRDTLNANLTFFNRNGYNHLIYKIDKDSNLIISTKKGGWIEYMAPFSLLFLFFTLFMLMFYAVKSYPYKNNKIRLNFKNRLQLSMISIILISFILIGISMVYYIRNLNENKNRDLLSEKALSILVEVQSKLAQYDTLTEDLESYMSNYLVNFSNVFFTDINLYDQSGNLLASSRPQVFYEGLLSRKMDPGAYFQLVYNKKTIFIHKEQIGNLEYYSAYVPFYNNNNVLIAYLNLPYFARENELKQELSTFMMTFINIYVFLIAIAIIIALFIAGRMTRPLKEIREKISHVRLGGRNEKIDWQREDDEIGSLVTEYNRMIDELALSAELLAKSERESAWREMAKQVAHEIKNPLTPMKLSVQYLEKAWKEKSADWESKLERFTKTLVEQIDSLSAIATAFSDFAKMPKSEMQELDLIELISNVLATYTGNAVQMKLTGDVNGPCPVLADRKQLNRALINLITNSVQAIDNRKDGEIMIHVEHKHEKIIISLKDNGPGIPEEQKQRIFVPNFSTKSEGMGLGLAMVKSIIEGHGGAIWFTSNPGDGASFFIELPALIRSQHQE